MIESTFDTDAQGWTTSGGPLEHLASGGAATLERTDAHGRHYRVDLEIEGPGGEHAVVRTGWLVAHGSDEARLTTVYVR